MDLVYLCKIAIKAAQAAGKVIQRYMDEDIAVQHKIAGDSYASQVVTAVDKECEVVILNHLKASCKQYNLAILSEETDDDGSRFRKDYFWCIDPMDGTLAFINKQPGFAVSIALVGQDGTSYIGVVYDPSTDTMYHAVKDLGAFKNNAPWVIRNTNQYLSYVTDRKLENTPQASKIKNHLSEIVEELGLSGVKELSGAGAVMNAIRVLENGSACMLKLPKKERGGGCIWDYAATTCIYNELSLPATNYHGGILDLNRRDDTFMNHEGVSFSNL